MMVYVIYKFSVLSYISSVFFCILVNSCPTSEGAESSDACYKSIILFSLASILCACFVMGYWMYIWGGILLSRKWYIVNNFLKYALISIAVIPLFLYKYGQISILIPVGISYFTLQSIGYLLDVSNHRIRVENNFVNYALLISFFPVISSGPISRAKDLLPQIKRIHVFNYRQTVKGLKLFVWGLFMKVVIANRAGVYVDVVYSNYLQFTGVDCLLACFLYSFQIYTDFAGYSYMAVGCSNMLGYNIIENLNRPYLASSITEFWRRWHISLTNWLKTHVYIALGGNRCPKWRHKFNVLFTFIVSGLFHGVNVSYIIWGFIHGASLIVEKSLQKNNNDECRTTESKLNKYTKVISTFMFVSLAWIFFRMESWRDSISFVGHIFSKGSLSLQNYDITSLTIILIGILIMVVHEILVENAILKETSLIENKSYKWLFYLILCCMILTFGNLDSGQFIYAGF